jgi:hypothetical protein
VVREPTGTYGDALRVLVYVAQAIRTVANANGFPAGKGLEGCTQHIKPSAASALRRSSSARALYELQ